MSRVAIRYARALFEIAQDQKVAEELLLQINGLVAQVHQCSSLRVFFLNRFTVPGQAYQIITSLAKELKLSILLKNFLCLLADARRLDYFIEIAQHIGVLQERSQNILHGTVISARPLTVQQIQKLTQAFSDKFKQTIVLDAHEDETLLGGMVVNLGPYCLDTSLKTKLQSFQTLVRG